jgi:3-(3-hydroxy-phenyl)propionate hydroxylase
MQAFLESNLSLVIVCISAAVAVLWYSSQFATFPTVPSGHDHDKLKPSQAALPVLVVGAGPTGLTLAVVLARYGVPVRIIEQKSRLSRHSKASNVMQRNQEFLYALGLLQRLNETGGQMSRLMVHAYGKCFGPRTMHLKESPFRDVVLCGQHNFEQVMATELERLQVSIEFGTRLIEATQNEDGVAARIMKDDKEDKSVFAYMVGCDGGRGISRTFTNLDFEITKTGVAIRQVDCKLQWRRLSTMDQMWLFYFDHGFAVVIPLPGGFHRVLCIEPKPCFPERDPTLEEMQAKLRLVVDDPSLILADAQWFSYTDLSMGIAPAMQDGCIILAGDVSNPILPNGGQGMNTGITDAFNLGWKLAAVLRYNAPRSLLRTYDIERHAVRSALQKSQFNSLRYTTLITPKIMQTAFRWFAEPLLNRGGEYAMAQIFSELTINARESPLSLDADSNRPRGGLRAGDRALDASVVLHFTSLQLYTLIYRGSWTLLLFSGCGSSTASATMHALLSQIHSRRPDLTGYVVSTEVLTEPETTNTLFDLDEAAHRVYVVDRPTIFLIRPDGHVAVRIGPSRVEILYGYLDRWAPDASQSFSAACI